MEQAKRVLETFRTLHEAGIPLKEFPAQFEKSDKKYIKELLAMRKEVKEKVTRFQDKEFSKPEEERLGIDYFRETLDDVEKLLFDDIRYVLEKRRNERQRQQREETASSTRTTSTAQALSSTANRSSVVESPTQNVQSTSYEDPTTTEAEEVLEPLQTRVQRGLKQLARKPKGFAPPGYRFIHTPPDGDCMFYSVFHAWLPETGIYEAIQPSSANLIREFLRDHVQEEDLFDVDELLGDIQKSMNWRRGDVSSLRTAYMNIQSDSQPSNVLEQYKKIIMLQSFWGADRELGLLNKYGSEEGFPILCIYSEPNDTYQTTWSRGCAPIHYNGYNHYSILQKIPNQENIRERYLNLLERRATEREILARKRYEVQEALRKAFKEKGGDINIFNKMARLIPISYTTVSNANSTAQGVYDVAKKEGATDEQAQVARNTVKAQIIALQGGKRYKKTRKIRKSQQTKTRKH